jgi:NAD(P)-dependent dehydrogenase (short-subunit alcohol dehydrogenase family)
MSSQHTRKEAVSFAGRVAIVTGASNGLGREYALALAQAGAAVIINARPQRGAVPAPSAQDVVEEILGAGGKAQAICADVTDAKAVEAMVDETQSVFGRVDILINNAGFLRDKSFGKMTVEDFQSVMDVHLMGAFHCCKAVWPIMQSQGYGRILMTTSSSGLSGNFGQANYAAAKMAVIGLMNTLHLEGLKKGIRVNAIAPLGRTRLNEGLAGQDVLERMPASAVVPAMLYLASEDAPSRAILVAGAGVYAAAKMMQHEGIYVPEGLRTPHQVAHYYTSLNDDTGMRSFAKGSHQDRHLLDAAAIALMARSESD